MPRSARWRRAAARIRSRRDKSHVTTHRRHRRGHRARRPVSGDPAPEGRRTRGLLGVSRRQVRAGRDARRRASRASCARSSTSTSRVGDEVFTTTHAYPDRRVELHFFRCELLGEPRAAARSGDAVGARATSSATLEFPPADAELIRDAASTGRPEGLSLRAARRRLNRSRYARGTNGSAVTVAGCAADRRPSCPARRNRGARRRARSAAAAPASACCSSRGRSRGRRRGPPRRRRRPRRRRASGRRACARRGRGRDAARG